MNHIAMRLDRSRVRPVEGNPRSIGSTMTNACRVCETPIGYDGDFCSPECAQIDFLRRYIDEVKRQNEVLHDLLAETQEQLHIALSKDGTHASAEDHLGHATPATPGVVTKRQAPLAGEVVEDSEVPG